MTHDTNHKPDLVKPLPLYFLCGLILVNSIAIFHFNPFYIGSFFSFLYIVITPGLLLLPFLTDKKLPAPLGIAFSVALSLLLLMLVGLGLNTFLPMLHMSTPLSTIPLIIAFDVLIYILLIANYVYKKNSPFEFHDFNAFNWIITLLSLLLPIAATVGAIMLNNGGSNFLILFTFTLAFVLVPIITFSKTNATTPPLTLYMMVLSFLLMNSMRGWFITGHDILLEYHVFSLTDVAHRWDINFYKDPYNACLSLTILPTYIQELIHVGPAYIFKFFTQFIGALPVVVVYYITKQYVSDKIAFLAGFLYISFPTYMIDMAFLNRQGIAFLFFGALVFALLNTEHFVGRMRTFTLFLFGIGVIISHYSTSYVAIAVLIGAYVIDRILRFLMKSQKPQWLFKITQKIKNREMYWQPKLITLPLVIGLLGLMIIWSTLITKTSTSLFNTIHQIVVSVEHPFSFDGYSGPTKYSLISSQQPTPQELFNEFLKNDIKKANMGKYPDAFYPLSLTQTYKTIPISEQFAPLTSFGKIVQSLIRINLKAFFAAVKQIYAKVLQLFLLIGLIGVGLGYSFKKNLLKNVPVEFIALSISGLIVIVGQTILPGNAIDYGLLRLFQQNLVFLVLPITLGFLAISSLITRFHKVQLVICTTVLLFFFAILSGLFPQITGGARALLSLNNYGLYYDSYYVHAEEVASIMWIAQHGDREIPIQAAHFSDIKMIAYGHISSYIELLPETTKKQSYVYLNYDNTKTSNIIEIVNGDVVYYHFPMPFLEENKNLIYNNGGSEIYR